MNISIDNLYIPNRFESLLASPYLKFEPLIIAVDADLRALGRLRNKAVVQQGGLLAFLSGATGVGKTTAVYSAAVHLASEFNAVFPTPSEIDLRQVVQWLTENLPEQNEKALPVLFDGREVTDDSIGLRQFLASLNQLLRRRSDILFLWPTTDPEWHEQLRDFAERIGGASIAPKEGDIIISGPAKGQWPNILERILIQYDFTPNDIALEPGLIESTVRNSLTVGAFLENIGRIIAERTARKREIQLLPSILFVISSGSEVVGEANRLRRAGSHIIKAEELLAYSPRSVAGKWWRARLDDPQHHLAYIISLFDARLATLTPSAVAYACLHHGLESFQQVVREHGITRHTVNAATTLKSTDLYRSLAGQTTRELTSSRKGKTKEASLNAYRAIQALSSNQHKEINLAICRHIDEHLEIFDFNSARFEVDAGEQDLYTDCIVPISGQNYYFEFHHLNPDNCKASRMSSYIMDKLQKYAVHFNLVPR